MSFLDLPPVIERMLLVSDKISDLNFSVGQQPQVEVNGKLTSVQPLGSQKLTPYQTAIIALTSIRKGGTICKPKCSTPVSLPLKIGSAPVCTPVTFRSRMPSHA